MQALKYWIKKNFSFWLYRKKILPSRRNEIEGWINECSKSDQVKLSDTSFDIFTYHGEDGIILYLINQLKNVPERFVDIGAGDCIKGNCTTLTVHFGWQGVFIDRNEKSLGIGERFYKKLGLKQQKKLSFISTTITPENVNSIIKSEGENGGIGLLSIDVDGNDYWVWQAIEVINPVIVVIEAKVEYGSKSIVVPYSPFNHRSIDIMYNGASIEALKRLGDQKGYQLVGGNKQGYNLFFVRKDKVTANLPDANANDLLDHPDTSASFYPEDFFAGKDFARIT